MVFDRLFYCETVNSNEGNDYSVNLAIYNVSHWVPVTSTNGTFSSLHNKSKNYWGFDVLFDTPVSIIKDTKYCLYAVISGPDSFVGRNGKSHVESSGVTFTFGGSPHVSKTGVKTEQLPEIIFSLQG